MNYFDMLAHYNYHLVDKDVIWSYPLGQRTYVDTIDKLFKFNYPEKLSNKYKVNILHTEISDPLLLDKIKDRVKLEMKKITPYYDSMICKLICQGRNRLEAIQRMQRSLDEFVTEGITTTVDLHKKILTHEKFVKSNFNVSWLDNEKII